MHERADRVELREVASDDPLAFTATDAYVAELRARFPGGFDPGATGAEPGSTWVVGLIDGEPVAYGGIRPLASVGDGVVEVKRMWVDPGWRGAGLGSRMLRHLESLAAEGGAARIVLDTNATLVEAIAMYERHGYRQTERYNDNPHAQAWFEKAI